MLLTLLGELIQLEQEVESIYVLEEQMAILFPDMIQIHGIGSGYQIIVKFQKIEVSGGKAQQE